MLPLTFSGLTLQPFKNETSKEIEFINIFISKKLTNESLERLAEILQLIAENSQECSNKIYEKCVTIYEYLEKNENIFSLERHWKIQRIKNVIPKNLTNKKN